MKIIIYILCFFAFVTNAQNTDAVVGANTGVIATQTTILANASIQQTAEQKAQTGIITSMNTTMTWLEKADRNFKKAMEEAEWVRNLQTAKKLYTLIQSITCTYKDINVLVIKHGVYKDCFFQFEYDYALLQLQSSIDMMSVLLANGRSMTADGRLGSLDNIIDKFGDANKSLSSITNNLQRIGDIKNLEISRKKNQKEILTLRIR